MEMKKWLAAWKFPVILLLGIGISNLGGWIYFIALNLIVLEMTQSALAVSALYILRPLSALFTNLWSGTLIDRVNKRNLMVALDMIRAVLIALLPLHSSVWYIYVLVFFIHMAGSIFTPASGTYVALLIPHDQRKRFNALNGLIGSGAFLIGPAIAGMLFLIGEPTLAIYINAAAMFMSGFITMVMPNLEKTASDGAADRKMTWGMVKGDWAGVIRFYRSHVYIMTICILFGSIMVVMASAVDSLEAAFARTVLGLSESDYGILVSISGAGIIAGAAVNTLIVKRVGIHWMIGLGVIGVGLGYLIYAFSAAFPAAATGFFVLAFFMAFANTGYSTFYQNNIPVEQMGRVGSMIGFIEALLIMVATVVLGLWASWGSIQTVVIAGVLLMVMLGAALCAIVWRPSQARYFAGNENS